MKPTPIFKTPAHMTSDGQHKSRVFHEDYPGRIVAVFHGKNHIVDSEEFCRLANLDPAEPENLPEEDEEPPVEYNRNAAVNWWHTASLADRADFLRRIGAKPRTIAGVAFDWSVFPG